MKSSRKNAVPFAVKPVVEGLEQRHMLSATLTLSNSLMVFNAVKGTTSTTQALYLTNTGDAPLSLGSGGFSIVNDPASATPDAADFSMVNVSSVPASLSPGQSFPLVLQYSSAAVELDSALLDINSSDPNHPLQEITLRGIGTKGLGGTNQPSLAEILRAYNIPTIVGEGPNDSTEFSSSLYPQNPDPSSQEVLMQRMVKAGAGPVTIQVLASFTASGFPKSYELGTYTPGNGTVTDRQDLFYTPSNQNQTTAVTPIGSTSFDPGSSQFGFYFVSNVQVAGRIGYTEDAFNTWDTTDPRKFRFFPLENPDGSVVANAYVMTTTEWNAPNGYDFTNIVAIVRNIQPANAEPVLGLSNPDAIPGSNKLIFSRIANPNTTVGDQVHNTNPLVITNTGDEPLVISSYSFSTAEFVLENPPTFPLTIAAGGSTTLTVQFTANSEPKVPYNETDSSNYPNGGGAFQSVLTLNTNDPNNTAAAVPLAGYYQSYSEKENEPSFQTIVNLLAGLGTNIVTNQIKPTLFENSGNSSSPTYYGEEVVSGYWTAADPTANITVQQLAAFHTEGETSALYWFVQGHSGSTTKLIQTATDDGQTLFPLASNTSTPATATFSTTTTFGFKVDSDEYSDDALNPTRDGGGHHFRFYPVRTSTGMLVPNTYLMTMDYDNPGTGANFDFQDNVYILTNVRPSAVPASPTDARATSSASGTATVTWAPVADTTLAGYNVYVSTSLTGTYALLTTAPITSTTFTDTAAPNVPTAYYKITAVDASTGAASLGTIVPAAIPAATVVTGNGNPVVVSQSVTTQAATAVVINVLNNATDTNGTILPATVVVKTGPSEGTYSINSSNGSITYTPNAGFSGNDSFTFTVTDSTGIISSPATVSIAVTAEIIGTPVAANLSASTHENEAVTVNVAGSATDGTSSATIVPGSVMITQVPADGIASVNTSTGVITYTPTTGFSGTDTLQYTIADSLSAVSVPATVTFNVSSTPVVAVPTAATVTSTITVGGTTTVDVVGSANAGATGTLSAGSVAVTTQPANGQAAVDSTTGAITYTPNANFVGVDSLAYTIADTNGQVSSPATLTFDVGTAIDTKTVKYLVYTDTAGTAIKIQLTGAGNAQINFTGTGTQKSIAGAHGTSTLLITGSSLVASSITITNSTGASSLNITHAGRSLVTVGAITINGPFNAVNAPLTNITGDITSTGVIRRITAASITGDTTSAAAITTLVLTGNFDSALTLNSIKPAAMSIARIGGQIGSAAWNVSGSITSLVTGSVASGWTGTVSGAVNGFTIRAGGFADTLTAGTIGSLSIVGDDTGSITAASVRSARVVGHLSGGSFTLTGTNPDVTDLGHLSVTSSMSDTQIISAGNIGVITAAGISGSTITAGVVGGVALPASSSDFVTAASIAAVQVVGRLSSFADSNIGAVTVGSMSLGLIENTASIPFGLAGSTIRSLTGTLASGGAIHLGKPQLVDSTSVETYISTKKLSLDNFEIKPGV